MLKYILKIDLNSKVKILLLLNIMNRFNLIFFVFFILFVFPNYIFGSNFYGDAKPLKKHFMHIIHKDKTAKVMCFYKDPVMMNSVYFKGPSEILLKAGVYKINNMTGHIVYYKYIADNGVEYIIKFTVSYIHNTQDFDMPVIVDVNGVLIEGYINSTDKGISLKKINNDIIKEFQLLPIDFKNVLRELYLYASTVSEFSFVTVYLGSIFGTLSPYKVYENRISKNEVDTIQDFLSEINYCSSEELLSTKSIDKRSGFIKLFKINIGNKTLTILYNSKNNKEEMVFKSSSGAKIMIYLTRNKFPGNLIKFIYKEKGKKYIIEHFIFTGFFENKQGIPIINGFNGNYIAGILDNKKFEPLYKSNIEKEIKKLPINLQKGLREFWEYCVKTLCEKEILNCKYKQLFGVLLNKKYFNVKVKFISSERLKRKMINEFRKIYGEE